ncbi:response regulator [Arenimonas fontis]
MDIYEKIKRLFGWGGGRPDPALAAAPDEPGPGPEGGPDRRLKPRVNARPGTRMLVVDDSPTIVTLLARMLRQNGYHVLEAGSAEEALEIARVETPELIFLDIVLPGMDGFACLRQLRRDPYTRDIPVIMISGNEQATEQFYVQRIGADDFMKKPFSRAEVFARIERLLDANQVPKRLPSSPPRTAGNLPGEAAAEA